MDGNRRWAAKHNLKKIYGHKEGFERLKEILDVCKQFNIKYITVYAFSSENLKKRPGIEKRYLFKLLKKSIEKIIEKEKEIISDGLKINFFGRWYLLPKELQESIKKMIEKTKHNNRYFLNVCLVYDGQEEIVDAFKKIAEDILSKKIKPEQIDKEVIKANLHTYNVPPPDLIIRTGMKNEKRISGFLLWDSSYSEFYFTETLWPDFTKEKFAQAIIDFQKRQRRFGK